MNTKYKIGQEFLAPIKYKEGIRFDYYKILSINKDHAGKTEYYYAGPDHSNWYSSDDHLDTAIPLTGKNQEWYNLLFKDKQ